MSISSGLNELSKVALVACDNAYAGKRLARNDPLAEYVDDPDSGTNRLPYSIPSGWVVDFTSESVDTGLKLVAFRNASTNEVIVAFAGVDNTNLLDWKESMQLGWRQWNEDGAGRDAITEYRDQLALENISPPRYTFTGQSLGGVLAEYAAFEFVNVLGRSKDQVSLITFNGLGSKDGILQYSDRFTEQDINNFNLNPENVAHYFVTNDLISRLGGGHIGGQTYELAFRSSEINPSTGKPFLLDPITAHRIETGFYRQFALSGGSDADHPYFMQARAALLNPISSVNVQPLVADLVSVMGGRSSTPLAAEYRLKGSLILAIRDTPKEFLEEFGRPILLAAYNSGMISLDQYDFLSRQGIHALKTYANAQQGEAIRYLLTAAVMEKLNVNQVPTSEDFLRVRELVQDEAVFGSFGADFYSSNVKAQRALAFATGVKLINPEHTEDKVLLARLGIDPTELTSRLAASTDWNRGVTEYLFERLNAQQDDVSTLVGLVGSRYASYLLESANDVKHRGLDAAGNFIDEVKERALTFTRDLAGAAANAFVDLSRKVTGIIYELRSPISSWKEFDLIRSVLVEQLNGASVDSPLEDAIQEALDIVESAGQTIVVTQGCPQNPFDDSEFDPDAAAVALGAIKEGQVKTFTVFVPYEAQEGGQHVSLQLGGSAAGRFKVLLDADEIDLGVDGEFDLLIAEGSRSISFGIWAQDDVDTDETLSLSATLVDAEGNATHVSHLELNLALDAQDEAPPAGGREIRGDWAPKAFPTDPVTGPIYPYRFDDLDNIERDPGVPNTEGFQQPGFLRGSDGNDHIVTGDFEGEARGFEGDDSITGSELQRSILYGGAGNDWIEAMGYAQPQTDYFELEYLGRTIKLGEEKIYAGAGDDVVWGESAAAADALYDPTIAPTGLPGDWISGGSGADKVYGGAGDDVLMGGVGEDQLVGGAGMDVLLGDDAYEIATEGNFWRVLHPNFGDSSPGFGGFEVGLFPIWNITAAFPDMAFPSTGDPDFIYYKNGGGADILVGGKGKDILIGQWGDDVLYGGGDSDVAAGWEGDDQLIGGTGDDLMAGDFGRYEQPDQRGPVALQVAIAGARNPVNSNGSVVDQAGKDFLDGGAGNDVLYGEGGADTLLGGEGNDTLFGDADYLPDELHGADTLEGGAGNDVLVAHAGDDRLSGGAGDDALDGGWGNDLLDGGTENDLLAGGEGDDTLEGRDGADALFGGGGNDRLSGGEGNDELDGGDGDDVLLAQEGEDRLEGGSGNDSLYGGNGADVVSGGAGDDLLDAGAGIDIVRGGEGNDIYVINFGYGRDLIEDTEGANRIQFGSTIAPDQIAAEWAGSALTVAYGFTQQDAFTADLAQFQLEGLDFAGIASWTKRNLVNVAPRVVSEGSEDADAVEGVLYGRNDLRGLGGDDEITGAGYDDYLAGGEGADTVNGVGGSDRYFHTADESGIDQVSDSNIAARAYLDWYYRNLGIPDWEFRAERGGQYQAVVEGEGTFTAYFDTYEEAVAQYPDATITVIEPLPSIAPLVRRDDTAMLEQLVSADILDRDVVEFGAGLALSDLDLRVTVSAARAADYPEEPWHAGGTLSIRWGEAGLDVEVPDINYGFTGTNLLTDGTNNPNDPGAWRGYRLGEGIEAFQFADGSTYTLEEVLQQATVVQVTEPYHFFRGSGTQLISRGSEAIVFEDFITTAELAISRDGVDLLLTLRDGSEGRIEGWYADPANLPLLSLRFPFDLFTPEISAQTVTDFGLMVVGTEDADHLLGLDGFPDLLIGGGGDDVLEGGSGDDNLFGDHGDDLLIGGAGADALNGFDGGDVLDGGAGDDRLSGGAGADAYVLENGGGLDTIDNLIWVSEPSTEDVIRIPQGLTAQDLLISRTSQDLTAWIRGSGDRIEVKGWFERPEKRLAGIEFFDGAFLNADAMESSIEPAPPTEEDDMIFGSSGADTIDGIGGDDQIIAGDGDDVVAGGTGDDYLEGDAGSDILRGEAGADDIQDWQGANLYEGGAGDDTIQADGAPNSPDGASGLVIGGTGNDWIGSYAEGNVLAFNAGDGQDTVYAPSAFSLSLGGGIAPAALSLSRDGTDLVLAIGAGDSIRLTREFEPDPQAWPQITLQLFGSVHLYDFNAVIAEFLAALAADPSLTEFPLDGALQAHEISVSETAAFGGALAYQYGTVGNLNALNDGAIRQVLAHADFGAAPQTIELPGGNRAPVLITALEDQTAREDTQFTFSIPKDTFSDPGDTLSFSAALASGSGLPAWLAFDLVTGVFSGMPQNANVGAFGVNVTATDSGGLTASGSFTLTVDNTNDAPVLENQIVNQTAAVGTEFNYAIASSFTDIDQGDELSYAATAANGDPLPAWLTFAAGVFAGTPGPSDVGDYSVLVTAKDLEGASATAQFELAVTDDSGDHGVHLVGTDQSDTITGAELDDVLEGLRGRDTLAGRAGDDLLLGGRGRDRLLGDEGQDVLYGERGRDVLYGGAGNDLLVGGGGNDHLEGGDGDDLYVHEGHGGHDVIEEQGGSDSLLLGEAVTPGMVRLERRHDDLVVNLSGPHGGVTVRDWFGSDSKKVETIQFADGTTWGVEQIRDRARRKGHDGGGRDDYHGHHHSDRDDDRRRKEGDGHERNDRDGARSERKRDGMADLLAAYFADSPRYDFEVLAQDLERSDRHVEALSAQEIARRWQLVARYGAGLTNEQDDEARSGAVFRLDGHGLFGADVLGGSFGYAGSTGATRSAANLQTFNGLEEGFRRLLS